MWRRVTGFVFLDVPNETSENKLKLLAQSGRFGQFTPFCLTNPGNCTRFVKEIMDYTGCLSVAYMKFNPNIFLTDKYIANHWLVVLNMQVELSADLKLNNFVLLIDLKYKWHIDKF
jgi:hypothetical protein